MKVRLSVFSLLLIMLCESAIAGWQNDGYYIRDGYYSDDGSRFTIGFRGGLSLAKAKMKNEMGMLGQVMLPLYRLKKIFQRWLSQQVLV